MYPRKSYLTKEKNGLKFNPDPEVKNALPPYPSL